MDSDITDQQEKNLNNPTKINVVKSESLNDNKEINTKNQLVSDQENQKEINEQEPQKELEQQKEPEQQKDPEPEPVAPYPIDDKYDSKLKNILKKQISLRPKTIFEPEIFDITKNLNDLKKEEQEILNKEKQEVNNALDTEKQLFYKLQKIKESSLTGNTLVTDPLALFHSAKKVYIDQFHKISDLFVICPLYYNYRISLEYDNPD